jgi:hypothetical protein
MKKMGKRRLYAAYGSNLNLPQMTTRCPTAKPVGTAELKGYELVFRGGKNNAVATVEPKEGAAVPVLVWDLEPGDEKALDWYEGFPRFYGKRDVELKLDGKPVTAMVYVMTPGHRAGTPSEYYLTALAEGYRTAGFDPTVLAAAVKRSAEMVTQEYAAPEPIWEQTPEDGLFEMKWR